MKRQWFFILALFIALAARAQSDTGRAGKDTAVLKDTVLAQRDTAARQPDTLALPPKPAYSFLLESHI